MSILPGQLVEVSFIGGQTRIGLFVKYIEREELLPFKICSVLMDEEIKSCFVSCVKLYENR